MKISFSQTENEYDYINALDRGGLTVPSVFSLDIMILLFEIFQKIIGKKESELQFLKIENQRTMLIEVTLNKLDSFFSHDFSLPTCDQCDKSFYCFAQKLIVTGTNIVLSNYVKIKSDLSQEDLENNKAKKRKMLTLTK